MKTHASILREIAVANISDYKKGNGVKQSSGDNTETSLQGHFAFIYRIDLLEVRSALQHYLLFLSFTCGVIVAIVNSSSSTSVRYAEDM